MNNSNVPNRIAKSTFLLLLALIIGGPAFGAELNSRPGSSEPVNVIQTSFVPRVITNVIEMRVPTNVFITVYRTNQFEVLRTNVFDVYRTNLVKLSRTNVIPVELAQTNLVTRYQTNLNVLTRTNFVTRYQTNVNTLTLTNWETVLVFKTNRFTQPVTNLVQIDLPAARTTGATAAGVEPKADVAPIATASAPTASTTEGLKLQGARTAKPSVNGQAEISLKVKSASDETPTFLSQEWQVQRTDNSVLLFGRGPEFKRELPLGTYKVEMKARSTEKSPIVRIRSNFEVTRDDVILQKPAGLVNAR